MGLETINLGTPGTQTGDTIRDALQKVNNNFNSVDSDKANIDGSNLLAKVVEAKHVYPIAIALINALYPRGSSMGNLGDANLINSGRTYSGLTNANYLYDGAKAIGSNFAYFSGSYFQVDLQKIYQLTLSRLYWYASDGRHYGYKIAVSEDLTNWVYVVGSAGDYMNSVDPSDAHVSGVDAVPTIDFLGGVRARYIRVYSNGNTTNTGKHLYEWELFGVESTRQDKTADLYTIKNPPNYSEVGAIGSDKSGQAAPVWMTLVDLGKGLQLVVRDDNSKTWVVEATLSLK